MPLAQRGRYHRSMGLLGALWGVSGWALLMGFAIARLLPHALQGFSRELTWGHWVAALVVVTFMAYAEGYRGFQKGLAPRVAARAQSLRAHPTALRVALSPLYCAGYFGSTPRRTVSLLGLTATIVVAIVLVRLLNQPWRGIADAGVVVGLSWGLLALLVSGVRALALPNSGSPGR